MPSITIDDNGSVYVLYASTTETFFNDTYNYKHIWARGYDPYLETWGDFMDLTNDIVHIFDECIYPQLTSNSDGQDIHYMYNVDVTPGLALDDDHAYQENRMYYAMLPKTDLVPVGIDEVDAEAGINVSQSYPNPASTQTAFNVELKDASSLSVQLSNIVGQVVMNIDKGNVNAGSHLITIDVSDLDAGTYFYTVIAGDSKTTKRIIVN